MLQICSFDTIKEIWTKIKPLRILKKRSTITINRNHLGTYFMFLASSRQFANRSREEGDVLFTTLGSNTGPGDVDVAVDVVLL